MKSIVFILSKSVQLFTTYSIVWIFSIFEESFCFLMFVNLLFVFVKLVFSLFFSFSEALVQSANCAVFLFFGFIQKRKLYNVKFVCLL